MFTKNKPANLLLKSSPLPDKFVFFLKNNIYKTKLRVKKNEIVLRGQPLVFGDDFNVPIHAPTSGWIEDISYTLNPINKYKENIKIIVSSDHLDKWIRLKPIKNYKQYTSEKLIQIIHQSGIVGLGGGEFSSAKKLMFSINKVNTLIVNAVESEPYITSDNCLLYNYTNQVLKGCKIISWICNIKIVLIAIQEDAIQSISRVYNLIKNEPLFKICILKKKYPGGSSKVLIKSLTGKEIPHNKHSIDIGYLVFNVSTIYSIKRAIINGEPLTERLITCLGDKNILFGNFWIRIGTPIKYFLTDEALSQIFNIVIYLGGSFMKDRIYDLNYSILKKTNSISIRFQKEKNNHIIEYNCIRCSNCSNVCPVNLLPQQLYWYSIGRDHKQAKQYHILDCIECKACEKVCPSNIKLVKYFKEEKYILKNINLENNRKKISLIRFHEREKRLFNQQKIFNKNNIDNKYSFVLNTNNIDSIKIENKKINHIEKNIRKKMVQEAIERMKAKNKTLY